MIKWEKLGKITIFSLFYPKNILSHQKIAVLLQRKKKVFFHGVGKLAFGGRGKKRIR